MFVRNQISNALRLPQDKYDTEAASALAVASWESIAPLMPQILEWMQDLNWHAPPGTLTEHELIVDAVGMAHFIVTF